MKRKRLYFQNNYGYGYCTLWDLNYKEFFVYMQKHEGINDEFEQGMKLDYIRDTKSIPTQSFHGNMEKQ